MHVLIHLVYSHIVRHSINLLQTVKSVKMLILLVEQLMLVVSTHWELIELVGIYSTHLVSPWLLVWDSIHVLLHVHLVVRVYHVSVVDNSAILVFLLDFNNIVLRSWYGCFWLVLLLLKSYLLLLLVVFRVFQSII